MMTPKLMQLQFWDELCFKKKILATIDQFWVKANSALQMWVKTHVDMKAILHTGLPFSLHLGHPILQSAEEVAKMGTWCFEKQWLLWSGHWFDLIGHLWVDADEKWTPFSEGMNCFFSLREGGNSAVPISAKNSTRKKYKENFEDGQKYFFQFDSNGSKIAGPTCKSAP